MYPTRWTTVMIVSAFLPGFGMGGTSLYYAQAQGLFGLSGSVQQFGTTLTDMKKNVDALQQNMASFTTVKDQLTALASPSSNPVVKEGETLKQEGQSLKQIDQPGVFVPPTMLVLSSAQHCWTCVLGQRRTALICLAVGASEPKVV